MEECGLQDEDWEDRFVGDWVSEDVVAIFIERLHTNSCEHTAYVFSRGNCQPFSWNKILVALPDLRLFTLYAGNLMTVGFRC
jgi:hypothetical protein